MEVAVVLPDAFGGWGPSPLLTDEGIDQALEIARELRDRYEGRHVLVLTSPASRAQQMADVIVEALNAACREHSFLGPVESNLRAVGSLLRHLIQRLDGPEALIVVTHASQFSVLCNVEPPRGICVVNYIDIG